MGQESRRCCGWSPGSSASPHGSLELGRRRPRTDHRRTGALSRPSGRAEAVAVGRRKPRVLGGFSRAGDVRAGAGRWTRSVSDALADLPAGYLSAGQRRRLSIARLLAVKRPIWLLDEPTSTLDAAARRGSRDFMRAHLAGGGMIVAATHGLARASRRAGIAARSMPLSRRRLVPMEADAMRRSPPSSFATCASPCASAAAR